MVVATRTKRVGLGVANQHGMMRQKLAQMRLHRVLASQAHRWRGGLVRNVAHAKFGEGVIVNIEGSGTNARAHINFGKFGMKLLDLGIAKLERI